MRYPWTDPDPPTEWFRKGAPATTSLVEGYRWAQSRRAAYWRVHRREQALRLVFVVSFCLGALATPWLLFKEPEAYPYVWRSLEASTGAGILHFSGRLFLYVVSYVFIFGVFAGLFATVFDDESPLQVWWALWGLSATILFAAPAVRALIFFGAVLSEANRTEQLGVVLWIFGFGWFVASGYPFQRRRR